MEQQDRPVCPTPPPYTPYQPPKPLPFPAGRKEQLFALITLLTAMGLCNCSLFGGLNLGFAMGVLVYILAYSGYLVSKGHRPKLYSGFLLGISVVIAAGYGRSDDDFVKIVMLAFLFVSVNLGLSILSGQQRHDTAGFSSLGDCFYTGYVHSFGRMGPALRGLMQLLPGKGKGSGKGLAIIGGLVIALPVVAVMVVLLMGADMAFEGLMHKLPDFELDELPATLLIGAGIFCLTYSKATSLQHHPKAMPAPTAHRGINSITVNTVLIAVSLVYVVYLFSQLAYFIGGFAGILPDGFTMAQYARRGFFEMTALCAINLAIIALCIGLVAKTPKPPVLTRSLCLFISAITVFFVISASGKMFMYMESYGLTRLRVLTQVIMLWLGISTVVVALWLLLPRLPYMKVIIAAGLIIGAAVLWADVDSMAARYNTDRYLSGAMEQIDIPYLASLNRAAAPELARLAEQAPDPQVRQAARVELDNWYYRYWHLDAYSPGNLRAWNYAKHTADPYIPQNREP